MDARLAELIGIVIGDGFLDNCQKHYRIGIAGHPVTDLEYFIYVQNLIRCVWKKEVKIKRKGRGIYLITNSKEVFSELTQRFKLPIGEGKCERVRIPEQIAFDWSLCRHTIRGIADTDGSIFFSDKPGSPNYPSIELNTTSIGLATQVKHVLVSQGFRVTKIWGHKGRMSKRTTYKVCLNGKNNVKKWMEEIGFSNPVKRKKARMVV